MLRQRGQDARRDRLPARPLARVSQHGLDRERLLRPLAGRSPGTPRQAITDPALRRELAEAGVTRSELLLQSIRLIQVVLSQSPKNPLADEASLALVGAFLELEDYEAVVKLSARFAKLYPKSTFLDSFQYSEALGDFHLGQYDRAIEVAETIAEATYKDANGARPAEPEQVAGALHPGPDLRRPPQPGQGGRSTTSRSPTASATPPGRSRR